MEDPYYYEEHYMYEDPYMDDYKYAVSTDGYLLH